MTLKELILFGLILFFALFTRLFRLDYPKQMYFDEVYHVPAAMMLDDGNWQTPFDFQQGSYDGQNVADWLHPPLAKYFQALSIHFLGKNPLAWRLPSLIFSLLSLIVFYFLLRFLGRNFFFRKETFLQRNTLAINLALIGSFLFSLDGLFLVQSRIAMNDVFLLFFLLLAVFTYFVYLSYSTVKSSSSLLHQKYAFLFLTGVFLGLALASKWTALWVILFLFVREFLPLKNFRKLPFLIFALLFTPFFIYFLNYLPMLFGGYHLSDFFLLQKTMALSQLNNPNMHAYSSGPLSWLLNLRPVWYFVGTDLPAKWTANIYALDNPLLNFYLLLTLLVTFIVLLKIKDHSVLKKTILFIFLLYLVSFMPWLIFQRPMFIYHYLPAVPFLIILLSYFLVNFLRKIQDSAKRQAIGFNLLFWPLFFFIIFYPHWTALEVPSDFANAVYFLLANWR
ncbi:MAG TPA: phospholipid carrier-dependent glycosyltransferase [Candidatus Woesebacteria bacterium]|nr:phospholipid carrier-dependent glycosyltransferase [Candidatus Woesebacteria bacterium]